MSGSILSNRNVINFAHIFFLDRKTLPVSRLQQVHNNGSLVIKNVQSETDGGPYECTAATRTGEKSSQSVIVNVVGKRPLLIIRTNKKNS